MAYVHWQARRTKRQINFWAAILVKNVRVHGTPTKQHVAYIAGISPERAGDAEHRARFWEKALAELDALNEQQLSRRERPKIEAALAARVPRPSRRKKRTHARTSYDPQRVHDAEIEAEEELERGL